jgi:cathepsin B
MDTALPTNFDPRAAGEKFSKCIHPIRDQAQCGSCWAFGATEAFSDRLCIKGTDVIVSPQDLVSCDGNNFGCDGGYL